jgi:hypothetical protein
MLLVQSMWQPCTSMHCSHAHTLECFEPDFVRQCMAYLDGLVQAECKDVVVNGVK